MANFEDIIRASAQRKMVEDNSKLHVPQSPMHKNRHYWGWVATPVAAALGIVFGISFQFISPEANDALARVVDTVKVTEIVQDTVYLAKVDTEHIIKHDTVYVPTPAKNRAAQPAYEKVLAEEPQCTSIQCDGIDYSLLVAN